MAPETLELREMSASRRQAPQDASRLAALLRRQAAAFDRLARQAASKLTEDRVHKLRVLTRRLRSSVSVARRLVDHPSLEDLRRLLRRAGRALGRRRTLDVALADHSSLDGGPVPDSIGAERSDAAETVARHLRPGRRARIAAAAREAAAVIGHQGEAGKPLVRWLGRRAGRLERAFGEARADDKEAHHRLRIEAKKVRYVLEVLREMGWPPAVEADRRLKALQRALGRAHDMEVLIGLVEEHAGDAHPLLTAARRQELASRRRGLGVAGPAVRSAAAALARAARLLGERA